MIVVDASVLANALGDDDDDGRTARDGLRGGGDLASPDLIDVETVAVLRKRWLARTISDQRFEAAVGDFGAAGPRTSPNATADAFAPTRFAPT